MSSQPHSWGSGLESKEEEVELALRVIRRPLESWLADSGLQQHSSLIPLLSSKWELSSPVYGPSRGGGKGPFSLLVEELRGGKCLHATQNQHLSKGDNFISV